MKNKKNVNAKEIHVIVETDGYTINMTKRHVFKGSERIKLTTKETDLLHYFIGAQGTTLTRYEILEDIWFQGYTNVRVVDDTIRRIRKKIPGINISNIYGYGYRYD
jgi:Response regulators consisting of a CheY-like receiver domain and a winged-helix DNA-binding domain